MALSAGFSKKENTMQVPLEITFHQVPPSPEIEQFVEARAAKLERFDHTIIRCRVAINEPHRRHRNGNRYDVHVEVTVPGKVLTVMREPGQLSEHQDVYQAIRDAFSAMERQLEEERRSRREVRRDNGRIGASITGRFEP